MGATPITDSSGARNMGVTAGGQANVTAEGREKTYSTSVSGLIIASGATDVFTLAGAGGKTVKIRKVIFSITGSANGAINVAFLKRSTADSGGTSSAPTPVPFDSGSPAAEAVARAYTANPTLGTLVGILESHKVNVSQEGTSTLPLAPNVLSFGTRNEQPIVLRGPTEQFAINVSGAAITAPSANITIVWTEE